MCGNAEVEARKRDRIASKYCIVNHIEREILSRHKISKSCYHGGDLEGNNIRSIMSMGSLVFEDACRCLQVHRPSHVKVDEIDNLYINFGRLCSLMDSVFSTLHSKR